MAVDRPSRRAVIDAFMQLVGVPSSSFASISFQVPPISFAWIGLRNRAERLEVNDVLRYRRFRLRAGRSIHGESAPVTGNQADPPSDELSQSLSRTKFLGPLRPVLRPVFLRFRAFMNAPHTTEIAGMRRDIALLTDKVSKLVRSLQERAPKPTERPAGDGVAATLLAQETEFDRLMGVLRQELATHNEAP